MLSVWLLTSPQGVLHRVHNILRVFFSHGWTTTADFSSLLRLVSRTNLRRSETIGGKHAIIAWSSASLQPRPSRNVHGKGDVVVAVPRNGAKSLRGTFKGRTCYVPRRKRWCLRHVLHDDWGDFLPELRSPFLFSVFQELFTLRDRFQQGSDTVEVHKIRHQLDCFGPSYEIFQAEQSYQTKTSKLWSRYLHQGFTINYEFMMRQ